MAFIQIDEDLHNLAAISRISFSEYPGYTGQWRADVYFRGDDEAYLTLPHTFTSSGAACLYAAGAVRQAELAGVCTEEDLTAIAGRVEEGVTPAPPWTPLPESAHVH